ncbi:hypothetical protein H8A99_14150 [Bradyrhizobium sp. Arg68]|uniref:hypothetical protein n=1 Tax=Bradyrhizobium ivorense TaxID=2511166 RepID=UPI001E609D75|nr:hypothetical protein [Bradyrhizobium ivorense]MCC8937580.1 hypothetical protein [Bradyrhizobium ivorense]
MSEFHNLSNEQNRPGIPSSSSEKMRPSLAGELSALGAWTFNLGKQIRLDGALVEPNSRPRLRRNLGNECVLALERDALFGPQGAQLGLWIGR